VTLFRLIELESELLTPTQLGKMLGSLLDETWSAQRINKLLIDQGFQVIHADKDPDYLPTEKGKKYSKIIARTADINRTVQILRWFPSVLEALEMNDH
jgi:hypothetical protein